MVEIGLIFNTRSRLILHRFHATAGFMPLSLLSHTAQEKQRDGTSQPVSRLSHTAQEKQRDGMFWDHHSQTITLKATPLSHSTSPFQLVSEQRTPQREPSSRPKPRKVLRHQIFSQSLRNWATPRLHFSRYITLILQSLIVILFFSSFFWVLFVGC